MSEPESLGAQLRPHCRPPLAIVGVGNPLRGDDAFGPAVIAALPELEGIVQFDAGMAPENWLGPIARTHPATILVLDTADMAEPPGTLRLLRPEELDDVATSTHGLPLGFFLRMAEERCGAPAIVLAVQPAALALGEEMTPAVRRAVEQAASAIVSAAQAPPG